MSQVAPSWEPARNPVHRLIQYLDALAVAFGQFRQQSFHLPSHDQPGFSPEELSRRRGALIAGYTAVTRRLFPPEDVAPARTAGRLADDAVAELVRGGLPGEEPLVRAAAHWLGGVPLGLPRTAEHLTDGDRHARFTAEGEWLRLYHPRRAALLGLLARMGQTVPPAVRDREVFAGGPPNRPPVPTAELVRWVDEARQVWEGGSTHTSPPPPAATRTPDDIVAAAVADRVYQDRNRALGAARDRLWAEFVAALDPLRADWYAAWRAAADAVGADDAAGTVTALAPAAGTFRRVQELAVEWMAAARRWRDDAQTHYPGWKLLAPFHGDEFARWGDGVAQVGGPASILDTMAKQHALGSDVERGIDLLQVLAGGGTAAHLRRLFDSWGGVGCLRGLAAALAAAVVPPAPDHSFRPVELPDGERQREAARLVLGSAALAVGYGGLAAARERILRPPATELRPPAETPAPPSTDSTRPTTPPDPAAFPDFYGRLAAALEWPDEHPDGDPEARARSWAPWLANATWFATRAGYTFRWTRPPDPADMHAAEGRRTLELAAAFERTVDSFVGRATLPQARRMAARQMDTEFVLPLARVLNRPQPLRDQFKAAVLTAADDLWRDHAARCQRSAPAGEGQPEPPAPLPSEGGGEPAADPRLRRAGVVPPDSEPTPVPAPPPAPDPIQSALDEHARERERERRWRAWEARARELVTATAAAFRDLAAAPTPHSAADLEGRFRAVGVALTECGRASREEHPHPPPPGERTEADRFRYLADPAHRHVPPAARVFAALVATAVDSPDGLRDRLDRLAGHPLLTAAVGWGAFLGEWQYGLRLRPEQGWQRLPSPPGSGSDMDAVTAGLDHREPDWVTRQREQLAAFAPPPLPPPAADPPLAATGQPGEVTTPAVPGRVRSWLQARYLSDPTPGEWRTTPEAGIEPVVFAPLDTFTDFLTAQELPAAPTLEACRTAGWIEDVYLDRTETDKPDGTLPPCGAPLGLPSGQHRIVAIRRAVLDSPAEPPERPESYPTAGTDEVAEKPKGEGEEQADQSATLALVGLYTNGIADERMRQAAQIVCNTVLTVNEKLNGINELIPFPATASAEQLGKMLRVSKQAVMKTEWWKQNRRGEKISEVGRRRAAHK